jgi:dihydropyrimidinase
MRPQKGTIAIGADADLALWDPGMTVELTDATTHEAAGYGAEPIRSCPSHS